MPEGRSTTSQSEGLTPPSQYECSGKEAQHSRPQAGQDTVQHSTGQGSTAPHNTGQDSAARSTPAGKTCRNRQAARNCGAGRCKKEWGCL